MAGSSPRTQAGPWLLLGALLVALLLLHLTFLPGIGPYGIDGSYYFQTARHVAEGRGILTSVSLYHQGLRHMPQPSNIYPLWVLVLGWTGRLIGLTRAANVLPQILFVADLLLLFLLTRRITAALDSERSRIPFASLPVLESGHLMVLLFGLNSVFFTSTLFPYTEGIAFTTIFACLLFVSRLSRGPNLAAAALAGAFSQLCFLARSQSILMPIAVAAAIAIVAIRRKSYWLPLVLFLVAAAAVIAPWLLYVTSFVKPFSIANLIQLYSDTPGLLPFQHTVRTDSVPAYVLDRLSGLLVAVDPTSPYSFAASFGPAAYIPLIGAVLFAARIRSDWRQIFDPRRLLLVATCFSGLATTLVLVEAHHSFFLPWYFGYRHGLTYVLLIALTVPYVLGQNRQWLRVLTLLMLLVSMIIGTSKSVWFVTHPRREGPTASEVQMVKWLDSQTPVPTVLTTNAQILSVYSRSNFHWTTCDETATKTRQMLQLLPIDYVLVYSFERNCPFARGLSDVMEPRYQFGKGEESVYVFRSKLRSSRAIPARR